MYLKSQVTYGILKTYSKNKTKNEPTGPLHFLDKRITGKSVHRCASFTGLTGVTGLTGLTGLT